jgi:glycosyltransferase 2 family protein
LPLFVAAVHPRVFNRAVTTALRLLRRPPLEHALSTRAVLAATALMLLTWLFFGLQAVALAYSLGASGWETVPAAIGGFALAYTAGLLLIIAPAGLGVREAVLIATLGTVMATADATALALVSRLLLMLADGLVAGFTALAFLRFRRRTGNVPAEVSEPLAPDARAAVADSPRHTG